MRVEVYEKQVASRSKGTRLFETQQENLLQQARQFSEKRGASRSKVTRVFAKQQTNRSKVTAICDEMG